MRSKTMPNLEAFNVGVCLVDTADKGAGTLRRAIRSQAFARILGGRHMECAYYFDFCRVCPLPNQSNGLVSLSWFSTRRTKPYAMT